MASQSPALRLFTQPFIQTQIKENIKAPRHWPLCGEFTGPGEFPAQRACYAENVSIWWRHHGICRSQPYYSRYALGNDKVVTLNMSRQWHGDVFRITGPLKERSSGHLKIPLPGRHSSRGVIFPLLLAWESHWTHSQDCGHLSCHAAHVTRHDCKRNRCWHYCVDI